MQCLYLKSRNDSGNFLKSLDFPEKGFLKTADFERFLNKAGIFATEWEVALILQRLHSASGSEDGISYEEFKQEIESIGLKPQKQNIFDFK